MIKPQGIVVKLCDMFLNASYVILLVQNCYFATHRILFLSTVIVAAYVRRNIMSQAGVEENRPAAMAVIPAHHSQLMEPSLHRRAKFLWTSFLYILVPILRLVSVNDQCWFFPYALFTSFGVFMYPVPNSKRVATLVQIFVVCVCFCSWHLQGKVLNWYFVSINLLWPVLLVFGIIFILQSYSTLAIEKLQTANAELEKSNKTKSEFLSMLGHEIRTPLNAIVGSCEILMHEETRDEQTSSLQIILSSANVLLENVNSMLSYFVLERGRDHAQNIVDGCTFDLHELCASICHMMRAIAESKGLTLQYEWHGSNSRVKSDKIRIREIIINLLSNACKFTEHGVVKLAVLQKQNQFEFLVQDSGIGISKEYLQHLYQPFSQQDMGIKRNYGGTGLGLAICQKNVQLLNGTIHCESKQGSGTLFTVALPLQQADIEKCPSPMSTNIEASSNVKCMIVDDNLVNLKVMSKLLETLHIRYDCASSGSQALQLIRQNKAQYDVILLDFHMPDMSGSETSALIHTWCNENQIHCPKIVLVTGSEKELIPQDSAYLFDDYCQKPIRMQNVTQILHKYSIT